VRSDCLVELLPRPLTGKAFLREEERRKSQSKEEKREERRANVLNLAQGHLAAH
jgi:hypothetical protein